MKRPIARGSFPRTAGAPQPGPIGDDAAHWRRRAAKLHAAGDHKRAADAYRRYLVAPIADPHLRAAAMDMAAGRMALAANRLQQFLAVHDGDPVALRMLGQIAFQMGSARDAEPIFRRLVEIVPGYAPLRFELASALLVQGHTTEALTEADALLRRDPGNHSFLNLRAAALHKLGDIDAAIAVYERMIAKQPQSPMLRIDYGNALRARRRSADAIAAFRRAASLKPEQGEAWWNLSNMKVGAFDAADLETMRTALASVNATAVDRYHLRFAIARALEEQGAFGQALDEYKEANRARLATAGQHKGPTTAQRVASTVALFTPEFLAARNDVGDPSPDPIFIVGMPRSGSTLLEQILSAHPLIEGTQELPDLIMIAQKLDAGHGGGDANAYPEAIAGLSGDALHALGAGYIATTRTKRRTDRPFFIDKQPANWLHVGLIQLILPNARIIDMRRNALANCLSLFRQHFPRGVMYSYSIDALAAEYRGYRDVMRHFDAVSPTRIERVRLESLVADPEGVVRDLLQQLGLPFASECLRFYESDRPVFTPSSEQVRRPINDEGQAMLANYEPYLDEFRAALGDIATM